MLEVPLYYDKDTYTSGKIAAVAGKLEKICGLENILRVILRHSTAL